MHQKRSHIYIWIGILLLFILMVIGWGYTFGHENSIQLTPLLLHAHDSTLYPGDFYVQEASARFPNERSFYLSLLMPFGEHLEWPSFLLFTAASILLFRSLIGIGEHISGSKRLAFAGIILLLFPLNFHALGMNELFSRELSATLMSDAIAAAAIWMLLRNKIWLGYSLIILSTFMHPLAGLQLFLLVTGSLFIQALTERNVKSAVVKYGWPVLVYLCTGGVFIALLQMGLQDEPWDDALFFQSFFVFRNAHHYMPTAYSTEDWMMLGPLFILAPLLLFRKQRFLWFFCILILAGCLVYSLGVLYMHSVTIATAQWFKSTMWLEAIAVFALLGAASRLLSSFNMRQTILWTFSLVIVFSLAWWLIHFPTISGWKTNTAYELPFYERTTPEIDISRQIAEHTAKDALFIQPASLDELKYYSKRSGYVDYKALTHTKGFIHEWSARFEEIYSINPATSDVISFAAVGLADQHFRNLTPDTLQHLHTTRGITHIVTFADVALPYPIIAQNQRYIVYQL